MSAQVTTATSLDAAPRQPKFNDFVVWLLIAVPFAGPLAERLSGVTLSVWTYILANSVLMLIDSRQITRERTEVKLGRFIWLAPVYLFRRARALQASQRYLVAWVAALLARHHRQQRSQRNLEQLLGVRRSGLRWLVRPDPDHLALRHDPGDSRGRHRGGPAASERRDLACQRHPSLPRHHRRQGRQGLSGHLHAPVDRGLEREVLHAARSHRQAMTRTFVAFWGASLRTNQEPVLTPRIRCGM